MPWNRVNLILKTTGMLEHQKLIIKNVSHNGDFFKKEILKSVKWLNVSDLIQLFEWLKNNFWQSREKEIKEVLQTL